MMKTKSAHKNSTSVSKPGQPISADERWRMIAAQPVTDGDLAALGQARAAAVRDRLLAETPDGPEEGTAVEPERVLLAKPREVDSGNDE